VAIATTERVSAVVEHQLGVKVEAIKRQTRWRPTWFIEGSRDGAPIKMVIRGERVDTVMLPLDHEIKFHRLLEDNGIPVPKLYGWLDELGAVAMEMVPGKPNFKDVPDAERDVIVDEYLQVLNRVHRLDIGPFVEAGLLRADRPENSATVGHWHIERQYRAKKRHPDPFMEFCMGWLHRHPPLSRGRATPVIWDTGQFHHANGHLAAVLDLEFGHVGDPMLDLALWRMRDTVIPFGEFKKLYRRYEELSGKPVDIAAIKLHHFAGTLENQQIFGPAVLDPVPETDLMNNMQWNSETNLHATEALAEFLDIELPTVEMPEPRRTRQGNTFKHLANWLRNIETDEYLTQYDLRLAFRMARHLQRANEIGDTVVEADLDDLHKVLGRRPASWWEGDEELERFVLADALKGKHDEQLVWLFHRRNLRVHMQLGPVGSSMVAHYPTQRFN
jgi:aminoglycoside phosphotransferase (APT) family kinase protein